MLTNRYFYSSWYCLWIIVSANMGAVAVARATWEDDMLTAMVAVQNNTAETITKVDSVAYQLNDIKLMNLPAIQTAVQDCYSQLTYLNQFMINDFKPLFETMNTTLSGIAGYMWYITEILDEAREANVSLAGIYYEAYYTRLASEQLSDKIRNNYEGETGSIWSRLTDDSKSYSVGESSKRTMEAVESTRQQRSDWTYATRIEGDNEFDVNVHVNSIDGLNFENGGIGNTMPVTIMNPIPLPVSIDTPVEVFGNVNVQNEVSIAGSGDEFVAEDFDNSDIVTLHERYNQNAGLIEFNDHVLRNVSEGVKGYNYWGSLLTINVPEVQRVPTCQISLPLATIGIPNTAMNFDFTQYDPWLSSLRTLVGFVFGAMIAFMSVRLIRQAIS